MPDCFKVRLAKVGGYRNYPGPESITFVDVAVAKLNAYYGHD